MDIDVMITAKYVFKSPVFLNTKNNGTIIAAVGIIIENDVIKNRALFFLLLNIQKAYPAIDAIITPHTEDNVETSIEFDNDDVKFFVPTNEFQLCAKFFIEKSEKMMLPFIAALVEKHDIIITTYGDTAIILSTERIIIFLTCNILFLILFTYFKENETDDNTNE